MSDLHDNLRSEFQDPEYRYAYAESFLNTKIATQIKVLRESRGLSQADLGRLVGTKQSGFSRFEDVNHSSWKTDTLWKIARGLGVRVDINFETFGSLISDKERFSRESLLRPKFEDDPAFNERVAYAGNVPTPGAAYLQHARLGGTPGFTFDPQPSWLNPGFTWHYNYPARSVINPPSMAELLDQFGVPLSKRPDYVPTSSIIGANRYTAAALVGVLEALARTADIADKKPVEEESRHLHLVAANRTFAALTPPIEVSAQISKTTAAGAAA